MSKPDIEVIARGVLWSERSLLICRNVKRGHRFLPGGHIDPGEPASKALEREMKKELGGNFQATNFLGVCEASFIQEHKKGPRRHHELNLIFELEPPSPDWSRTSVQSQEEHITFEWLSIEEDDAIKTILPNGIHKLVLTDRRPVIVTLWE